MGNVRQFMDLMKPSEVAVAFRVDVKTIYRWTKSGRLHAAMTTPGGQSRYSRTTVELMLALQDEGGF